MSPSHDIAFMANLVSRDMRTVTGRNVRLLVDETGLDPWTGHSAGLKMEFHKTVKVHGGEEWRLEYLRKLLEQRQTAHYKADDEEERRISKLINSLCVN